MLKQNCSGNAIEAFRDHGNDNYYLHLSDLAKSYKEIRNHFTLSSGLWTGDQSTAGRSLIYSTETRVIDVLDKGNELWIKIAFPGYRRKVSIQTQDWINWRNIASERRQTSAIIILGWCCLSNFCQIACNTWGVDYTPGTHTLCQRLTPWAGQTGYTNFWRPLTGLLLPNLGPWETKTFNYHNTISQSLFQYVRAAE